MGDTSHIMAELFLLESNILPCTVRVTKSCPSVLRGMQLRTSRPGNWALRHLLEDLGATHRNHRLMESFLNILLHSRVQNSVLSIP